MPRGSSCRFDLNGFRPSECCSRTWSASTSFVAGHEFDLIIQDQLPASSPLVERLRGKHLIRLPGEELPLELLAMKIATRYRRLAEFTGLHIFVVSLRCEHSCPYCQVSRQSADKRSLRHVRGDGRPRARAGVRVAVAAHQDRVPGRRAAPQLPARSRRSSSRPRRMNEEHGKHLVIRDRDEPRAARRRDPRRSARRHDIYISTSLDGPARPPQQEPSAARRRQLGAGGRRHSAGARDARGRSRLGADDDDRARASTAYDEIIDCYVELGLDEHLPSSALAVRLRDQDEEPRRATTSSAGLRSTRKGSTTSSS